MVCAPLVDANDVPPVLEFKVLLYHWYDNPDPVAVTVIGENATVIHFVCVDVDCELIAAFGFVINAPETALVAFPQVPVTIQ